ncbi:MAG: hypothetical protein JW832_12700 [Deltaproteobacteria bacterium]|nr:hypothetical protein [Deltaproteobacteria bacterium]
MDSDLFVKNYLHPSIDGLDRQFTLPLPDDEGLEKTGEFIVQSHCPSTYSTNVITRYERPGDGIRLVEVYKSSQNMDSGKFVRLVGTMALVKKGYPFLFLDAAVTNINMQNGEAADLSTRIAIHMPQATDNGRVELMKSLSRQADEAALPWGMMKVDALPPFWGPLWHVRMEGVALEAIEQLRLFAWNAYHDFCAAAPPAESFDYLPVQVQMILQNSKAEQGQFLRMGLHVPVEVQAAFFSILCTGV